MKVNSSDHVDGVREQWSRELPELDTNPVGIVLRVTRLARNLDQRLQPVFLEHGLAPEGFDTLTALRRAGPPYRLAPTDLYRQLMRSSGTMTHRLNRLEKAGLIRRAPNPHDARGLLVELTDEGRDLVERVFRSYLERERELLTALTPEEMETLAGLLRKLLLDFEDERPA